MIIPLPFVPRTIQFSGYSWTVKGGGPMGPGPNYWADSADSVFVDAGGSLHLKVRHINGRWRCVEVNLDHPLGYGTYRFSVETPANTIPRNAVLGLFTWSDAAPFAHREIDVELSRWNDQNASNAQFVIQPYQDLGKMVRFEIPDSERRLVQEFKWRADRIDFVSRNQAGRRFAEWTYAGTGIPPTGDEGVHINVWLMDGAAPSTGKPFEIVISKFEFIP